jgi:hypothetical protein
MVHNKFIVVQDTESVVQDIESIDNICLIVGKVSYHRQLLHPSLKVLGGGLWSIVGNTMSLFGSSHEFGAFNIDDVKVAVENKRVYTSYIMNKNLTDKYTFVVKQYGEVINLK